MANTVTRIDEITGVCESCVGQQYAIPRWTQHPRNEYRSIIHEGIYDFNLVMTSIYSVRKNIRNTYIYSYAGAR